jgi:hypothetical protein
VKTHEKTVTVPATDQEYLIYDVKSGRFEKNSAIIAVNVTLANRETFIAESLLAFLGFKRGTKAEQFINWLVKKAKEDNVLIGDTKGFSREAKVNKSTAYEVFETMMDMKLIRRVDRGIFVFHPSFANYVSNAKVHAIITVWKNKHKSYESLT